MKREKERRNIRILILGMILVCTLISCDMTGEKITPQPSHVHSYEFQDTGILGCVECEDIVDGNYIAIVDANKKVLNYGKLNESNSTLDLTVEGNNITYTNTSGEKRSVVINTAAGQNLTINAPEDDVIHYGEVKSVNVIAVAENSYHGKATVEESITVEKGNIELEVSVPEVKVEARGNVSLKLGQEVKIESLSLETKEGTALQTIEVGGTGTVEKLETTTPVKIETKVEEVEVKSEKVTITLTGNAEVTEVKVDDTVIFTSSKKLEINIEGEAKVEGVSGVDSSALETTTEPGAAPVHIHNWDAGQVTTKATCTTDGVLTRLCTDNTCSEKKTEVIKALGHEIGHHEAKAPTCTEVGWEAYDTCKRDGCTYTTYVEKKALGHDYKSTVVPPTQEAEGYTLYECSRCHHTYKDNFVTALSHVFGSPVWTWSNDYSTATAKFTCTTEEGHVEEKTGVITTTILKAATCTEHGSTQFVAEITLNGTKYTDTKTVAVTKLGHNIEHHEAKTPTCTEVGWEAYDACSRCEYSTYKEIPATGHSFSSEWTSDTSYHWHAATCGHNVTDGKTAHSWKETEVISPTCLKTGSKSYECTVCGATKTEEIPKSDHVKVVDSEATKSSLLVNGHTEQSHCKTCGRIISSSQTLPLAEPRLGNSRYGFDQFASEPNKQEFYDALYVAAESVMESEEDYTPNDSGLYEICSINYYSDFGLNEDDAVSVWKIFLLENPAYYFMSQNVTLVGENLPFIINEEYATYAKRQLYNNSIEVMANECSDLFDKDDLPLTKAVRIHDFISDKITYAYKSDGVTQETSLWAHNITGVSYVGRGVCESYAKTFLYLCNLNDVDCLIAVGNLINSGEAHAWNYICIDDNWYLVDVTLDDSGNVSKNYCYFGLGTDVIGTTYSHHLPTGKGTEFLYELPELSSHIMMPVDVYKNGSFVGIYSSPDAAFETMSGKTNEYEIALYRNIRTVYSSEVTELPEIKKLIISSSAEPNENDVYRLSAFDFANDVSLNCNLELRTILLEIETLELNDNELIFDGNLSSRIDRLSTDSKIDGKDGTILSIGNRPDINVPMEVKNVRGNTIITIRADVSIENLNCPVDLFGNDSEESSFSAIIKEMSSSIQVHGNVDLKIGNKIGEDFENISIFYKKNTSYPTIRISGTCEGDIHVNITGHVVTFVTDPSGNEVARYESDANPFELDGPYLFANQSIDCSKFIFEFNNQKVEHFGYDENYGVILLHLKEVVDEKYLKSEATCTNPAVYYYSSEEGEAYTTETFVYGGTLGHKYDDNRICTVCGHERPEDILTGEFTVSSDGEKVNFARGNLWYNTFTETWNLEESQLDYQTSWDASHVDKFYWSEDASIAVAEEYSDPNRSKSDEFFAADNFTVYGYTKWGTLSPGEWYYLLFRRSTDVTGVGTSNARFARVIVNGVKGLLLFPDSFVWNTSTMGTSPAYVNDSNTNLNSDWSKATSYTLGQFEKQEEAGIVFLPGAGYRNGSSIYYEGSGGFYCSSSQYGYLDYCSEVYFLENFVGGDTIDLRSQGDAVRLVTRVE